MGLFDDLSHFLEIRLEEFLRHHPHLELQALEEQIREQEDDTLKLISDLKQQDTRLKAIILETAQEIQLWHTRIAKAKAARRWDLVEPAEARESQLLRQGNQFWGQRQGVQDRLEQSQNLLTQIQQKRQELQKRIMEARATRTTQVPPSPPPTGWNQDWSYQATPKATDNDPLSQKFRQWEMDEELEQLKKRMKP